MSLSIEEVAPLLLEVEDLKERLQDKGIHNRRMEGTVPLGTLTCGELIRMSRALVLLSYRVYPELQDRDVLEQAIRSAALRVAGGAMN